MLYSEWRRVQCNCEVFERSFNLQISMSLYFIHALIVYLHFNMPYLFLNFIILNYSSGLHNTLVQICTTLYSSVALQFTVLYCISSHHHTILQIFTSPYYIVFLHYTMLYCISALHYPILQFCTTLCNIVFLHFTILYCISALH